MFALHLQLAGRNGCRRRTPLRAALDLVTSSRAKERRQRATMPPHPAHRHAEQPCQHHTLYVSGSLESADFFKASIVSADRSPPAAPTSTCAATREPSAKVSVRKRPRPSAADAPLRGVRRRDRHRRRCHAFPTPGVSWPGETVFGRPCRCFLALGSGLRLVGTASARR